MQARCRGIEADIRGDRALRGARVERGGVRKLVNEAAGRELLERCNAETRIAIENGMQGLTTQDREELRRLLRHIVDNLNRADHEH